MKIIKPKRREHRCLQTWKAAPEKVFPLLCPVRETDWIPGWQPKFVVSNSGVMELDCIFVEPATPNDATWIVTRYELNRFVEMYRIVPEATVRKFSIKLEPGPENTSRAYVAYDFTAIGKEGEKVVDEFTAASFNEFMKRFETAINHYLTTGQKIAENH